MGLRPARLGSEAAVGTCRHGGCHSRYSPPANVLNQFRWRCKRCVRLMRSAGQRHAEENLKMQGRQRVDGRASARSKSIPNRAHAPLLREIRPTGPLQRLACRTLPATGRAADITDTVTAPWERLVRTRLLSTCDASLLKTPRTPAKRPQIVGAITVSPGEFVWLEGSPFGCSPGTAVSLTNEGTAKQPPAAAPSQYTDRCMRPDAADGSGLRTDAGIRARGWQRFERLTGGWRAARTAAGALLVGRRVPRRSSPRAHRPHQARWIFAPRAAHLWRGAGGDADPDPPVAPCWRVPHRLQLVPATGNHRNPGEHDQRDPGGNVLRADERARCGNGQRRGREGDADRVPRGRVRGSWRCRTGPEGSGGGPAWRHHAGADAKFRQNAAGVGHGCKRRSSVLHANPLSTSAGEQHLYRSARGE